MAVVLPFIGSRYNSQLIGNLAKVIAPSYDAITAELQSELHARHEFNVVRLEQGQEMEDDDGFSNKYTRAANTLKTWRSDGVLIEDQAPSMYIIEQEFRQPGTDVVVKRRGFLALVKVDDFKGGSVRPHKLTFDAPKEDRLKLLRATRANISPVLMAYDDADQAIRALLEASTTGKAWEEVVDDDGVTHRMWVVQKKDFIMGVHNTLADRSLLLAEGHHLYETAIAYRNEMRAKKGARSDGKQPFDYIMTFLTSADDAGLTVCATHRALTKNFMASVDLKGALEELADHFDIEEDKVDLAQPAEEAQRLLSRLAEQGQSGMSFAAVHGSGRAWLMTLQDGVDPCTLIDQDDVQDEAKMLDVTVLHHYIINQVLVGNPEYELDDSECFYVPSGAHVLDLLRTKRAQLAFLVNPASLAQLSSVAESAARMPAKSTCFFPRVLTGLILRNMEMDDKVAMPKRSTGRDN